MPLYSFRCPLCGLFDATYLMRDCPAHKVCPTCNRIATKVITPIRLSTASAWRMQLTDFCQSTAENPPLVRGNLNSNIRTQHSSAQKISQSNNPLHHTLPKP